MEIQYNCARKFTCLEFSILSYFLDELDEYNKWLDQNNITAYTKIQDSSTGLIAMRIQWNNSLRRLTVLLKNNDLYIPLLIARPELNEFMDYLEEERWQI